MRSFSALVYDPCTPCNSPCKWPRVRAISRKRDLPGYRKDHFASIAWIMKCEVCCIYAWSESFIWSPRFRVKCFQEHVCVSSPILPSYKCDACQIARHQSQCRLQCGHFTKDGGLAFWNTCVGLFFEVYKNIQRLHYSIGLPVMRAMMRSNKFNQTGRLTKCVLLCFSQW